MPEDERHDKAVKILLELARTYKPYGEVSAYKSRDYKKISIISSHKRGKVVGYPYYPDLWCKYTRSNKLDIFEVWNKQNDDACVDDIVLAALTPNVQSLYIVCLEKSKHELAQILVKVILSSLFNEKKKYLLDPSEVMRHVKLIPNEILKDDCKMREFLHDELEFAQ